jgi:hypothetical protein
MESLEVLVNVKKFILALLAVSVLSTAPASAVCFLSPQIMAQARAQTTARTRFVELKRKINNFVEEHKTAFIIGGTILAAAAVIALGAVTYKMLRPGAKSVIDPQALLPRVDAAGAVAAQAALETAVTSSVAEPVVSGAVQTAAAVIDNVDTASSVAQTVVGGVAVPNSTSSGIDWRSLLKRPDPVSGPSVSQLMFAYNKGFYGNSKIATEN